VVSRHRLIVLRQKEMGASGGTDASSRAGRRCQRKNPPRDPSPQGSHGGAVVLGFPRRASVSRARGMPSTKNPAARPGGQAAGGLVTPRHVSRGDGTVARRRAAVKRKGPPGDPHEGPHGRVPPPVSRWSTESMARGRPLSTKKPPRPAQGREVAQAGRVGTGKGKATLARIRRSLRPRPRPARQTARRSCWASPDRPGEGSARRHSP